MIINILLVFMSLFVLLPFLIFLVVKAGAYGYFSGRSLWKNSDRNVLDNNKE